jgi:hypothetical protein
VTTAGSRWAEQALRSPAGCAFLIAVKGAELALDVTTLPSYAMHFVAIALAQTDEWRSDHDVFVREVLARGRSLKTDAFKYFNHPNVMGWFSHLSFDNLIWCPGAGVPPQDRFVELSDSPPNAWELYAQKPERAVFASSEFDGDTSFFAALEHGAGDFRPSFPLPRVRLRIVPTARIYRVDGAESWHRLSTAYPAKNGAGFLSPDWGRMARHWDGVHLSLGAVLTASHVAVVGDLGVSRLDGWAAEQVAVWRWVFDGVEPLPELSALPPRPPGVDVPTVFSTMSPSARELRPLK